MTMRTRSQRMALAAYRGIDTRLKNLSPEQRNKYWGFARSFPSLIHACGLAQAVAFARAKERLHYLDDLAAVLHAADHPEAASAGQLEQATREHSVSAYVRLSRNALQAAGWLKRYVEASSEEQ